MHGTDAVIDSTNIIRLYTGEEGNSEGMWVDGNFNSLRDEDMDDDDAGGDAQAITM